MGGTASSALCRRSFCYLAQRKKLAPEKRSAVAENPGGTATAAAAFDLVLGTAAIFIDKQINSESTSYLLLLSFGAVAAAAGLHYVRELIARWCLAAVMTAPRYFYYNCT